MTAARPKRSGRALRSARHLLVPKSGLASLASEEGAGSVGRPLRWVALGLGATLLLLALSPAWLLVIPRARGFAYRQIGYARLADALSAGARSPEEFLERTMWFVNENVYPVGTIRDASAWVELVRSQGWCDQVARDVAQIVAKKGLPARIVFDGGPHHSVGEVWLDGRWRFFDAQNNYLFRTADGELATFEQVARGGVFSPKFEADRRLLREPYWEQYHGGVIDPDGGRQHTKPLTEPDGVFRSAIILLMDRAHRTIPGFDAWYQDRYLARHPEFTLVERGREYRLFDRIEQARRCYERALQDEALREDALFYLGRLQEAIREEEAAVGSLTRLLTQYPNTKWKQPAYYFLGEAHRALGRTAEAAAAYRHVTGAYLPGAYRLSQLSIEQLAQPTEPAPSPSAHAESVDGAS